MPDKIKYNNIIYNWDISGYLHYEDEHYSERAFLEGYRTDMCLNDEVEIIGEEKEIKRLKSHYVVAAKFCKKYPEVVNLLGEISVKINELIDKVNDIK